MSGSLPTNATITLTGVGTLPVVKGLGVLTNGKRVIVTTDNNSGAAHDPFLTIVPEDGSPIVQVDLLSDFTYGGVSTWTNTLTTETVTILPLAGNEFVVAWDNGASGGNTHAFFRVYNDSGVALTATTQIDATEVSGDLNRFVKMAQMSNGNFASVWAENGTAYGLRIFQPDGSAVTGQIAIDSVTGNPGGSEYTHYIAASGTTLMVVYQAYGTSGSEDLHTYFTLVDGTTGTILDGGTSHQVSSNVSGGSQIYNVAGLSNGNFAVIYPVGTTSTELAIITPAGGFVVQDQVLLSSTVANTGIYALADGGFVITHGGSSGGTLVGDIYDNSGVLQQSSVALTSYSGSSTATSYVTAPGATNGLVVAEREGNGTTSSTIQVFGHTDTSAPCFAAGTRIATVDGPVCVETLRAGDRVRLARGGSAAVVWVGHRVVECRRHGDPAAVQPIRILAGAFADGVPAADLVLSPDHAVHVDGVLIPVHRLVNGVTVVREATARVSYWHVELAEHDILLAEGLECESYLDTGNRGSFANGGGAVLMQADFARGVWGAQGCAPLIEGGPVRDVVHLRLIRRAERLGLSACDDADVVLEVDGMLVAGEARNGTLVFTLPAQARRGVLRSRHCVPAELGASDDHRRLGVAVAQLALDGRAIGLAGLRRGWHQAEADWRWTDGAGEINLAGAARLSVTLAMTGQYHAATARRPAAA